MSKKISMKEKYKRQPVKNFLAHAQGAITPKYFFTLDEAITWVNENGGGSVSERGIKTFTVLFRLFEEKEIRTWGSVYANP